MRFRLNKLVHHCPEKGSELIVNVSIFREAPGNCDTLSRPDQVLILNRDGCGNSLCCCEEKHSKLLDVIAS